MPLSPVLPPFSGLMSPAVVFADELHLFSLPILCVRVCRDVVVRDFSAITARIGWTCCSPFRQTRPPARTVGQCITGVATIGSTSPAPSVSESVRKVSKKRTAWKMERRGCDYEQTQALHPVHSGIGTMMDNKKNKTT